MNWYVYILECSDESLYTGITNDISKRIQTHNSGRGAKSIRGRLPVILRHTETYDTRGRALVREAEIKRMSREQKLRLLNTHL